MGQSEGQRKPIIDPRGYVLIRVGKGHHLADVRGLAYEHRLVAKEMLGRRLVQSEEIHHINRDLSDNRPQNLIVCASKAEHKMHHRPVGSKLRRPGEPNETVRCACGCGETFTRYDSCGRERSYVSGHNGRKLQS